MKDPSFGSALSRAWPTADSAHSLARVALPAGRVARTDAAAGFLSAASMGLAKEWGAKSEPI